MFGPHVLDEETLYLFPVWIYRSVHYSLTKYVHFVIHQHVKCYFTKAINSFDFTQKFCCFKVRRREKSHIFTRHTDWVLCDIYFLAHPLHTIGKALQSFLRLSRRWWCGDLHETGIISIQFHYVIQQQQLLSAVLYQSEADEKPHTRCLAWLKISILILIAHRNVIYAAICM